MSQLLKAENISMNYHTKSDETKAIDNVSFTALEGEFISIVGPSGCGKSTLLSIVAGLLKPSSGKVYINDIEITGVNSSVGYMFQQLITELILCREIFLQKQKESDGITEFVLSTTFI